MFVVNGKSGRTEDYTVTIKDPDGGYIILAEDDVVRVKIGRGIGTPDLDLDTVAATANGSVVTVANVGDGSTTHASVTVRLHQDDISSMSGTYTMEVAVVDNSDSDVIKAVDSGLLNLETSLAGDVGIT